MGNQLTSAFNISEESQSTGGPNNLWKIYSATKKSNDAPVSLFTVEKKRFDKESKSLREELFNGVRKEVKTLMKLRHPSVLHVIEPLNEDSKLMCFATEPIEGSLKYLIETPAKRCLIPSEIELKTQLLELIDAVTFLHNNAHLVHLSLSPENIYLTAEGKFKIAGFFFSQTLPSVDATVPANIDYSASSPTLLMTPHFAFTAPEVVKEGMASAVSDGFSLGCFIYNLLQVANNGKSVYYFDIGDRCSRQAYLDEITKFRSPSYSAAKFTNFTTGAVGLLEKLLVTSPTERLKLGDAHNHAWFNDPRIKTLEYLEHLNEKEHQHKLQFLSGLVRVLSEFDSKVILRRILPRLASYLSVDKISSHVLPPIIAILEKDGLCSKTDFYNSVWPHLDALCKGKEISAQALYIIIKHTDIWLKLVQMQDFQGTLLVLYQKGIDCGVSKIQEHAITIIPTFAKRIEYATLKNMLLPKILRLALGTAIGSLRLKCIESISNFAPLLDSAVIKGAIIPTLEKLSKTDTDGKLHLTMIKTVESFLKIFSYEELATKVIPLLLSMSVSGQFSKSQFGDVMSLIRRLVDTVDNARGKELHEIAVSSNDKTEAAVTNAKDSAKPEMDKGEKDMFDFLNQLGSGAAKEGASPSSEAKSGKEPNGHIVPKPFADAASKNPSLAPKDEWDMVFNIGKDSTPSAKSDESSPESKVEAKKTNKEGGVRHPPKTLPPPPKMATGPMKLAAKPAVEGFGTVDFLAEMGPKVPATGGAGGLLSDIDWGAAAAGAAPKGNLALLKEDPFAELEGGGTDNVQQLKHSEVKQAAPLYNPFAAGAAAKKENKKQPPAAAATAVPQPKKKNSIDDFFAELSSSK